MADPTVQSWEVISGGMPPSAWLGSKHTPKMQGRGMPRTTLHLVPHLPQFMVSLRRLAQVPSQQVWPMPQPMHSPSQVPLVQALPMAQAWPHLPQLAASLAVSTQALPQQVCEPLQPGPVPHLQLPPLQVSEARQLFWHEPQLPGSLSRLLQPPVKPGLSTQHEVPPLQTICVPPPWHTQDPEAQASW